MMKHLLRGRARATGVLGTAVLALTVSACFLVGSRLFWLVALRRYTGASA